MSNGPHEAAVFPPDAERCPHYHRDANPSVKNANPNCPGRCRFYAGHPHPPAGRQDRLTIREGTQYSQGYCQCDTCHLWVRDWIQIG
jgi:hypothetical protein